MVSADGSCMGLDLLERVANRDRRAIAKAITMIEKESSLDDAFYLALQKKQTDATVRIGITGPPGAGKSTLIAALAQHLLDDGKRVAILAIDPSSSFTNGAVLGDRVRMLDLPDCDDVYIRSMATRGKRGGVSHTSSEVSDLLAYAGYDYVFIETVGVGQAELEIRDMVDTAVVVLVPESGDRVQAIKAGLMEIADIYVVNKCDRPGSDATKLSVQSSLGYQHRYDPDWQPHVVATQALNGVGVASLRQEIDRHAGHCRVQQQHAGNRKLRIRVRLQFLAGEMLMDELSGRSQGLIDKLTESIANNECSLRAAATKLARGEI